MGKGLGVGTTPSLGVTVMDGGAAREREGSSREDSGQEERYCHVVRLHKLLPTVESQPPSTMRLHGMKP